MECLARALPRKTHVFLSALDRRMSDLHVSRMKRLYLSKFGAIAAQRSDLSLLPKGG
jgi:hypothetical protein